jgi:hypothetical protein
LGWWFLLSLVFLAPRHCEADALGCEFLPLNHWSYNAFERFEALGLLTLPSERPYTRHEGIAFVLEIKRRFSESPIALSERDRFNLERLEREFEDALSRTDPQNRYDSPVLFLRDPPLFLEGDADMTLSVEKALFDENKNVFSIADPSLKLHFSQRATYEVQYHLTFGPERGNRARNQKPSPRERSFKGLTSLFERSYVIVQFDKFTVFFGREYTDWGPSCRNNLLVSHTGGSLDQIGARMSICGLRLSFFQAILSSERRRYLAGHRLEARIGRLLLGVSETALYAGRDFDLIYALPFSSFYANQFNEGGDDNILWTLDAKYAVGKGVVAYGSLLIDDFQFERGDRTPDKLAFDVGGTFVLSHPFPATLRLRYRFIDIYTYTHRDSITAHIAGSGSLQEGESLIAGAPGPDSDEWMARLSIYPRSDVVFEFRFLATRLGEGNDLRPFERPLDPFPHFPLGIVERTVEIGASLVLELEGNSRVSLGFSRAFVDNVDHLSDQDTNSTAFRIAATWDL